MTSLRYRAFDLCRLIFVLTLVTPHRAVNSLCGVDPPSQGDVAYNQWLSFKFIYNASRTIAYVDLYAPGNDKPLQNRFFYIETDPNVNGSKTIKLNMTRELDSILNGVITVVSHFSDENCPNVCTALPAVHYLMQNNTEPSTVAAASSLPG